MAQLTVLSGSRKGESFEIGADRITIGRSQDNRIALDEASVSSHHCEIVRGDGGYTLRDLQSTNGTCVNGSPVQTAALADGDRVQVGGIELQVSGTDMPAAPARPAAAAAEPAPAAAPAPATASRRPGPPTQEMPAVFETRRDSRTLQGVIVTAVIVIVAAAALWLLFRLQSIP